jgi:hypothetical protein
MVNNKIIWFNQNMENHPEKTVQPQSIWLWLSQLIRCAIVLVTLSERNTGGSGLQGHSPVLLG